MSKTNSVSAACKVIAQRIVDAENAFVDVLMAAGDISKADAERVFAYYRKHRISVLDAVGGRMTVKNGAFLDRDVVRKAAAL
jgi:hypothetical protein